MTTSDYAHARAAGRLLAVADTKAGYIASHVRTLDRVIESLKARIDNDPYHPLNGEVYDLVAIRTKFAAIGEELKAHAECPLGEFPDRTGKDSGF